MISRRRAGFSGQAAIGERANEGGATGPQAEDRPAHARHGYRADIDGLRAIAVLSVVLYHLQAPGFRGGFVGVDVFFVISGFLIGGHIADEVAAERFSLVAFYERRIRRILPALFVMLALVLLAARLVLFWPDAAKLSPIAASVVTFTANLQIAGALGGYSYPYAQTSPLLHTWSLAVEEQFYLVFPLLILAIARFAGRRYVVWLTLLALLSFAVCIVAARIEPLRAFYLAPVRAWELFLGALVAIVPASGPRREQTRDALALFGLGLIGVAVVLFNSETPFPSEYALAPCVGAALVLHGRPGAGGLVGRFLGAGVCRRVGRWSYSLYLIHWPLLVFVRYGLAEPLSVPLKALVLAASIGLAALSWRFVEQPFRGRGRLFTTGGIYAAAAGGAVLLLCAAFGLPRLYGGPGRYFPPPTHAQQACWDLDPDIAARHSACRIGAAATPHAVLWGDSHTRALIPAVAAAFAAHGQAAMVFAQGGCPPLLNVEFGRPPPPGIFARLGDALQRHRAHCAPHNATALRWVAAHRIDTVILAAHWIAYADTAKVPSAAALHLALTVPNPSGLGDGAANFETNLAATLAALQRLGVRVFVVEDAPQQDFDVPFVLAADARLGRKPPPELSRAAYDAQQAVATGVFERLHARYAFTLLRPQDILCAGGACAVMRDGQTLYQDDEHLSPRGALALVPAFAPVWRPQSIP